MMVPEQPAGKVAVLVQGRNADVLHIAMFHVRDNVASFLHMEPAPQDVGSKWREIAVYADKCLKERAH